MHKPKHPITNFGSMELWREREGGVCHETTKGNPSPKRICMNGQTRKKLPDVDNQTGDGQEKFPELRWADLTKSRRHPSKPISVRSHFIQPTMSFRTKSWEWSMFGAAWKKSPAARSPKSLCSHYQQKMSCLNYQNSIIFWHTLSSTLKRIAKVNYFFLAEWITSITTCQQKM